MATAWKSQQGNNEYALQFETDEKEKYKFVEKASQMAVDGIHLNFQAPLTVSEYEIALFHFIREQMYIKNGFKLVMSDEEIDARTLEAMEKLRAKAESPRLRGQYLRARKEKCDA